MQRARRSTRNRITCCVRGCDSNQKETNFHHFPKDEKRKSVWEDKLGVEASPDQLVCGLHFSERHSLSKTSDEKSRKLKANAVPDQNLPRKRTVANRNTKKKSEEKNSSSSQNGSQSKVVEENVPEMQDPMTSPPAKTVFKTNSFKEEVIEFEIVSDPESDWSESNEWADPPVDENLNDPFEDQSDDGEDAVKILTKRGRKTNQNPRKRLKNNPLEGEKSPKPRRRSRKILRMSLSEDSDDPDDPEELVASNAIEPQVTATETPWLQINDVAEQIVKLSRARGLSIEIRNGTLFVFKLTVEPVPRIDYSLTIRDGLKVELVSADIKLPPFSGFPSLITNVHDLESIISLLDCLQMGTQNCIIRKEKLNLITKFINSLSASNSENHVRLMREQVQLMNGTDSYGPYSNDSMLFFTLLYAVSPQAYKMLQEPYNLIMPTPHNLTSLLLVYKEPSDLEKQNFLGSLAVFATTLPATDKHVVLLMEEARIDSMGLKSYVNAQGMSDNVKVCVFSISSYRSLFRKVIQVLVFRDRPVVDAVTLHLLISKITRSLNGFGFQVVGVVTSGDKLHCEAMLKFRRQNDVGNEPYLEHPVHQRQFFHIIDPFYVLNAVWEDWVNSPNEMFLFPDFQNADLYAAVPAETKRLFQIPNGVSIRYRHHEENDGQPSARHRKPDQHLALQIFEEPLFKALTKTKASASLISPNTKLFITSITSWWRLLSCNTFWATKNTSRPHAYNVSLLEAYLRWFDRWDNIEKVIEVKPILSSFSDKTISLLKQSTRSVLHLTNIFFQYCPKAFVPRNLHLSQWTNSHLSALKTADQPVSLYEVQESLKNINLKVLSAVTMLKLDSPISDIVLQKDSDLKSRVPNEFELTVSREQLQDMKEVLPMIVYVASFCAHKITAPPFLSCVDCKAVFLTEYPLQSTNACEFLRSLSNSNSLLPTEFSVLLIMHAYAVYDKIFNTHLKTKFPDVFINRIWLTSSILGHMFFNNFLNNRFCPQGHPIMDKSRYIVYIAVNILINNYCQLNKVSL